MFRITALIFVAAISFSNALTAQEGAPGMPGYWQIGIGFGELPMGGSFKPSITLGYHFNEKLYCGLIYQFKDRISRDGQSFNVKSSSLEGLISSNEQVGQRFMLQLRYTPVKYGPYLSGGLVFNDRDTETMTFDARSRNIDGDEFSGPLTIRQSRPPGWGLALGIGYQYTFKNGFLLNTEWTPAWFRGYPQPGYEFSGEAGLSADAEDYLKNKMDAGFKSSVTNLYKVFHIGLGYQF